MKMPLRIVTDNEPDKTVAQIANPIEEYNLLRSFRRKRLDRCIRCAAHSPLIFYQQYLPGFIDFTLFK